ncbi:MAG: hypothetical protein ACIWVG_08680, partial [Gloeotrichia echinulata HAB0833]
GARPCAPTLWSIYLKMAVSAIPVNEWNQRAVSKRIYTNKTRLRGLKTNKFSNVIQIKEADLFTGK